MDFFQITFQTAGIETYVFLPPMVALVISFFTSMAGISGAFLLLPFQVSLLGFTSPSVSATNFLYNVVGTPGGIIRYVKNKQMVWPLIACILTGTLPGVLIGYYIRIKLMPDPKSFKLFIGIVLLYIGWRLLNELYPHHGANKTQKSVNNQVSHISYNLRTVHFTFKDERINFRVSAVLFPSVIVGVIGGIYGIGGGAIIAPVLISILHLPVYAVAGAVLTTNFMTSLVGMIIYSTIPLTHGTTFPPDLLLGLLFGIGGLTGMYFGAKFQHRMPEGLIKLVLLAVIVTVSGKYIIQYF